MTLDPTGQSHSQKYLFLNWKQTELNARDDPEDEGFEMMNDSLVQSL